jgi:hypothetical protein
VIAFQIAKDRDAPVSLGARGPHELHASSDETSVNSVEVVDAKEVSHAAAKLGADPLFLLVAVSPDQKKARHGIGRPHNDPTLWPTIGRRRGRVLE